ncbi:translational activator of cytochrome c oxidase 1-like isoform X2 [Hypomesus transpacificus]|uniref:translational activator of cytochrome c oxidase 1-like isoform X2 n=1 Tax=Hypomesus transpacificus TaxID=137520 RepID=UPI001F07AD8A|nr:translational activator of cytochrome c oxidase 1-like isoform X2 [Hypomesus transpacificus]
MTGGVLLRGLRHLRPHRHVATAPLTGARIYPVRLEPPVPGQCSPWTTYPLRTLHLCHNFCAGHNKWSKVKNIKGPKDAARSRMFMKFNLMIKIAVKDGGTNPDFNVNLAHIVEQCRSKNMPKASIEAAIKGAEKAKTGTQSTYEARGPGGCQLLIQVLTDNSTRSTQELKHALNKHGKGVVTAAGEGVSSDRALELAIEAGAEDVQETEDEEERPLLQFVCDVSEMKHVRASLEELGVSTQSSGMEFVSHTPAVLPPDQLRAASALLEALHDHPDVVRVWHNIQAQS